jgi:hypothetical protein
MEIIRYCTNCKEIHNARVELFRGHYRAAHCCKCNEYINMLSWEEDQEYIKEKFPNRKKSNDRIGSISEALTYGF